MTDARFALVVGTTETATIDGISAAGAAPEVMRYTPVADAELLYYGRPTRSPAVPVSPTGCPTPALVTRAVRELVGFDPLVVEAGLAESTGAPTLSVGPTPGRDVRDPEAVPDAPAIVERAREVGRSLHDAELVVGESVPGGTTTALGVFEALGVADSVSSSLPENPLSLKRRVVEESLAASGAEAGSLAGRPVEAVRATGDPVLAAVFGLAEGALATDTAVTLAGGTQMLAVAALLRHGGYGGDLTVATTPFVAADDSAATRETAAALDVDLVVTDPGFESSDHVAAERFLHGEAKEGAGMGGALALADREGVPMAAVRDRLFERYDALLGGEDGAP
ncbi:TIGR00303 family protein [Salinirubellus salinus]|uniref:UPF0284 protein N0B31_11620 n=1 Tax=Salinirubellus salinus TaxID=1364945 RepID=A0A9E7U329_9EURY|nr:TIGR00303 family protein [Salinirubellus salinus]UWM52800.1 TIGR00303 family protein [Salinirubellus salinus]